MFGLKDCKVNDEDCIKQCLDKNYGSTYETAKTASIFNIPTAAQFFFGHFGNEVADAGKIQGTRGLYGNRQQYQQGQRILRSVNRLKNTTKGVSLVGAFSAGFVAGANVYCMLESS